MKKIFVPFQYSNAIKIYNGKKTTTIRSLKQMFSIGLLMGESGYIQIQDKDFIIICRGNLTIDQAGGVEKMLASEGVKCIDDLKYQQTKDWFNGKGKLCVYDIKEITQTSWDKFLSL